MARARRLAMAKASKAPLARFLLGQSDVILILCGGPAMWYVAQKRQLQMRQTSDPVTRGTTARAVHQLRQVFTALLLGTELMARKATSGKTGEIGKLAHRLNRIVRDGLAALAVLGEPYPSDLLDKHGDPLAGDWEADGTKA
jgi:hypothetical protein